MKGRLILEPKPQNAFSNMSIDFVLLSTCQIPTLRIYSWSPPAVSIGRFQSLKDEVDIDYCDLNGISYTRRITGGGAVFHQHELTYSFCIPVINNYFSPDLSESYFYISSAVVKGLSKIDIKAQFKPINDLVVRDKKISGCAQTRKNNRILQHGTILMDLDINTMFKVLKVSKAKISDKLISNVKQRVTSINNELNKILSKEVVSRAIILGFEEMFNIKFEPTNLTFDENKLKKKFKKEIFTNPQWIYER